MFENLLLYGSALVVGILAVARLTRLITQDEFPPSAWVRTKWDELTNDNSWSILFHCHWCMAPWIVIPVAAWAWLSDFHISWWLFCGWLSIAYIASIIVERDEVVQ